MSKELEAKIVTLEAECARLREGLRVFLFGDATIADILWGELPDDAPMKITLTLGVYRRARALLADTREEPK